MDHPRRGRALIFNHLIFRDTALCPDRVGTDQDAVNLRSTLEHLDFHVSVHDNLKF